MRSMIRNKRTLYVCHRYQDGNIAKYTKPTVVKVNYQATNSESDMIALGLDYQIYMRIKADLKDLDYFTEGDRVYIDRIPNDTSLPLCKDADYEVDAEPRKSLDSIEVILKKLSGK